VSKRLPLKELLGKYRFWNEKTGKPLGSQLTHEAHLEMARRLRKLDERHQRGGRTPSGRRSIYCRCHTEWPCPDRRILDGENSDG
jgi:hypothetical protein